MALRCASVNLLTLYHVCGESAPCARSSVSRLSSATRCTSRTYKGSAILSASLFVLLSPPPFPRHVFSPVSYFLESFCCSFILLMSNIGSDLETYCGSNRYSLTHRVTYRVAAFQRSRISTRTPAFRRELVMEISYCITLRATAFPA